MSRVRLCSEHGIYESLLGGYWYEVRVSTEGRKHYEPPPVGKKPTKRSRGTEGP